MHVIVREISLVTGLTFCTLGRLTFYQGFIAREEPFLVLLLQYHFSLIRR